jgi:hypothetical protein
MPGARTPEQDQVRDLESRLEDMKDRLVDDLDRSGETLDGEFLTRFRDTVNAAARQVNESLPLSFPPEAGDEIRRTVIDALTEIEDIDEARPLDAVDRLLIRFEQIRHILRDAVDESLEVSDDDGQALAKKLLEWLPGVRQADVAAIIGTSTRTLQRLVKDGGTPTNRMRLVARMVALLRRAWTPQGVLAWFYRPRQELDGQRPVDVLEQAEYEEPLMTMVRQGRAGHGA